MRNPFDYANPVTDPELFAGRARELADVDYYLDLALTKRSVGLAFVGPRTSGKTSILNMAQVRAQTKNYLVARLDLTSADVVSEGAFLGLLYEALFLAAKEASSWGASTKMIYATFRDAMTGNARSTLRDYCDLAFPQAVSAAVAGGHAVGSLPAGLVASDLKELRGSFLEGPRNGIALLIDEGDRLTELPVALEKLRFIMGNSEHLAVIIAGTEDMLGSMDKVFAPIVRQFRRVSVRPFISPSETRQCLIQRLQKADSEGILTQTTYEDLHTLAQGEPYVAQLVAHYAYKRYLERPDDGFGLNVSILNDVLAQVEGFRDTEHGKFAATLRRYDRGELGRLAYLVNFPRLPLYERAKLDVAVNQIGRVKQRILARQRELKGWADRFKNDGVIRPTAGVSGAYELNGEQFDHLYAKLLANTKGVPWHIDARPLVELSESRAAYALAIAVRARSYPTLVIEPGVEQGEAANEEESELAFVETRFDEVMAELMRHLRSFRLREMVQEVVQVLRAGKDLPASVWLPTLLSEAGRGAARRFVGGTLPTARVLLMNEGEDRRREIWLQPADVFVGEDDWRALVLQAIDEHTPGMEALGWRAELVSCSSEEGADLGTVLAEIARRGWEAVRDGVADEIQHVTLWAYREGRADEARAVATRGASFCAPADRWRHDNDLGYMLMASGELEAAEAMLRQSCEGAKGVVDLPHYNLAVCVALRGRLAEAESSLRSLEVIIGSERFGDEKTGVLQVLRRDGAKVSSSEEIGLDLGEAVRRSLHAC